MFGKKKNARSHENRTTSPCSDLEPTTSMSRFGEVSQYITDRDMLDPNVVARCWKALHRHDAQFQTRFLALDAALTKFEGPLFANWTTFVARWPAEAATAQQIISAWYLGYVGTPEIDQTEDNSVFVTYENALMYQATSSATVIPSYARGGTNYWAMPPDDIGED